MAAWTPMLIALSLVTGRATGVPHGPDVPDAEPRARTWAVWGDGARRLASVHPAKAVRGVALRSARA